MTNKDKDAGIPVQIDMSFPVAGTSKEGRGPALDLQMELANSTNALSKVNAVVNREPGAYPTSLGRIPLFKRAEPNRRERFDSDNAHPDVMRADGHIFKRFGPGLVTFDLHTLVGVLHLSCDKQMHGYSVTTSDNNLVAPWESARSFNRLLGRGDNSHSIKLTMESLDRLDRTLLEVSTDGSNSETVINYGSHKLITRTSVEREGDKSNLLFFIIEPILDSALSDAFAVDLDLFNKLSLTGKSVYIFLGSQPESFEVHLEDIAIGIGYQKDTKKLKAELNGNAGGKKPRVAGILDMLLEGGVLKNRPSWEKHLLKGERSPRIKPAARGWLNSGTPNDG